MELNKEIIQEYLNKKLITVQHHPTLDLHIYNYTPTVQYDKLWDDVTMACRGLVLDSNYNIIARPWEKFFNLSEYSPEIQKELYLYPFTATMKMDGSLFIVFKYNNQLVGASRGSFTSEQAIKGTEILNKYPNIFKDNFTYLYEVIYQNSSTDFIEIEFEDGSLKYFFTNQLVLTNKGYILAKELDESFSLLE
jgi:RNA ligase